MDRLTALRYPDEEVVYYKYGNSGALDKVYSSIRSYVSRVDYYETGQIDIIEYGNGVVTDYDYDPKTLRLKYLKSESPQEGTIQDLYYDFDDVGNVTGIGDYVNTATQFFEYDDLNRLTQVAGTYGLFSYEYDSIGNIINNKGITCYYGQDGKKPHALTSTSAGLELIYDENGNFIQKGNKTFHYNTENRLIKVEASQKSEIEIQLSAGWNIFSLPFKPSDNKVSSVLSSLAYGVDYDQLAKYDAQAKEYKHYVHDPEFDEFSTLDYLSSYLIHITNSNGVILTIEGDILQDGENISLKSGWNLIGNPYLEEKDVEDAFQGLQFSLDYDQVSRYNNDSALFESYNRDTADTLSSLGPGDGTAVYCLRDTSWSTPVTAQAINVEFIYDGDGGRVKKISPNSTTTYIGSLYEVTDGAAKKHIFAGSNRVASVDSQNIHYFHGDHLGSSNVITDETGKRVSLTEYTPYGLTAIQKDSDVTNYKFTGKELDSATGLYYYGARYYDPEIGRFTQPDTIVQAPYDPQTLNRYSYCRNNPLKYTDPTGHWFGIDNIIGAIFGAIIGGINAWITGGDIWKGMAAGAVSGFIFSFIGGLQLSGIAQTIAHGAGGAASGAISALIHGTDVGMGALLGGASAGAANIAGGILPRAPGKDAFSFLFNASIRAGTGAAIGGATAAALGGDFWQGAQQGAVTSLIAYTANEVLHGSKREKYPTGRRKTIRTGRVKDTNEKINAALGEAAAALAKGSSLSLRVVDYNFDVHYEYADYEVYYTMDTDTFMYIEMTEGMSKIYGSEYWVYSHSFSEQVIEFMGQPVDFNLDFNGDR